MNLVVEVSAFYGGESLRKNQILKIHFPMKAIRAFLQYHHVKLTLYKNWKRLQKYVLPFFDAQTCGWHLVFGTTLERMRQNNGCYSIKSFKKKSDTKKYCMSKCISQFQLQIKVDFQGGFLKVLKCSKISIFSALSEIEKIIVSIIHYYSILS